MISTALLNSDGTQVVTWDVTETVDHGSAVIADEGMRRVTRATHERRARSYTLSVRGASETEISAVRQMLDDTQHGADWLRWRHPKDDPPGDAASAPLYRLVTVTPEFERAPAGQGASVQLVLERVGII